MAVKMISATITKNHAADQEIAFLAKSISKSNGRATVVPAAWELIKKTFSFDQIIFNKREISRLRRHKFHLHNTSNLRSDQNGFFQAYSFV